MAARITINNREYQVAGTYYPDPERFKVGAVHVDGGPDEAMIPTIQRDHEQELIEQYGNGKVMMYFPVETFRKQKIGHEFGRARIHR